MKKRILALCFPILLGLLLVLGLPSVFAIQKTCREMRLASISEQSQTTVVSPSEVVWQMQAEVNQGRALGDLRKLTGEEPICAGAGCYTISNRLTGSEGLRRATEYVFSTLSSLGYSPSFQDWSRSGYSDRNVIARKPGATAEGEEIYFVAHVDGVASYPAADDNASGVADNLELARILGSHAFSRTVVLLFTTGEEQGTLGVQSYLNQLTPSELGSIKYAVNVDMVGYDGDGDRVMELWHGGDPPSMAVTQMMSQTIAAYQLGLAPMYVVGCG